MKHVIAFSKYLVAVPVISLVVLLVIPLIILLAGTPVQVQARTDLEVETGNRDIQAFIYNGADLTLIKDTRTLYLAQGMNQVRFSWAGTRIDPTSLSLDIKQGELPVKIEQMQFPPGTKDQVIWHIRAEQACRTEVDIRYFTPGISWQPHYTARLSPDRTRMHLTGHVRVENRSGMDYPDAQICLVVGKIHLLDQIAALADQPFPYGRPDMHAMDSPDRDTMARGKALLESAPAMMMQKSMAPAAPKQIDKTGTAEYFVYTIEGKEPLTHGWARQLTFIDVPEVPVETLHVFDPAQAPDQVIQMVSFTSDAGSGLGAIPLPGGEFKVFQTIDSQGGLTFVGTDTTGYMPAGGKHRLNLGPDPRVTVTPKIMAYTKTHLTFDKKKNLSGFDEVRTMAIELANFSGQSARIEIMTHLPDPDFTITRLLGQDGFEKIDQTRFKLTATLSPDSRKTIHYTLTFFKGDRKWQHAPVPAS